MTSASHARLRRTICTALGLAATLALVGCTNPASNVTDELSFDASAPPLSVLVATGNITPVITVEGEVIGPVHFQITSDYGGRVIINADGSMEVEGTDGVRHPITENEDVSYVPLQTNGARVVPGLPLADATYSLFALVAPIGGGDLLRMVTAPTSVRAQVNGGAAPFACELLDERPSATSVDLPDAERFVACALPLDHAAISGLRGLIALQFDSRSDVLILPIEAVAGTIDHGTVYLRSGDKLVETPVELGASDGLNIEIVSGLTEGQEVFIPSPSLYR